jgi:hypothetical protein
VKVQKDKRREDYLADMEINPSKLTEKKVGRKARENKQ